MLATSKNLPLMTVAKVGEESVFHKEGKPASGVEIQESGRSCPTGSGSVVALTVVPFQQGEPRDK